MSGRTEQLSGAKRAHRENGRTGVHCMTEILGAGVALFDYDSDSDLDVFVVQSRGRSRLFRNNLAETHALSFTDVADESGRDEFYGPIPQRHNVLRQVPAESNTSLY
ncbi:MAG TPA: hypothetical protein VLV86_09970 [Vicinamibacterales bacterium]|nr:hypothetical protein [Vicinamibacterales bacterium]